ncbi:hypothetical protein KKI90_23010 [Xenorhabdus bovienii]|nr:hypothetical protein [Xenorhabdus bovienii]MDE1489091.1 hypothetical protein [Xenorhabdus bovienii]MDE9479968.1 hypothetical protein [Xenorhabdus bovienii]
MHDTTRDGRVRDRIKAVLLASEATVLNTIFMALSDDTNHSILHLF